MTAVAGVSHIPIQVRDIERSLRFYRDFLGLAVVSDVEEIHERHHLHRRGVYLRWLDQPRAPFVVLGQPVDREPTGEPTRLHEVGIDHVGFFVDDVDGFIERARAQGIARLGPDGPAGKQAAAGYGDDGGGHVKTAMFVDPDDIIVQLDQWCAEPAETSGVHRPWMGAG
jgi:catechol 2,3-dioxygenase-like lactoylglutathione lyase family enzyme